MNDISSVCCCLTLWNFRRKSVKRGRSGATGTPGGRREPKDSVNVGDGNGSVRGAVPTLPHSPDLPFSCPDAPSRATLVRRPGPRLFPMATGECSICACAGCPQGYLGAVTAGLFLQTLGLLAFRAVHKHLGVINTAGREVCVSSSTQIQKLAGTDIHALCNTWAAYSTTGQASQTYRAHCSFQASAATLRSKDTASLEGSNACTSLRVGHAQPYGALKGTENPQPSKPLLRRF